MSVTDFDKYQHVNTKAWANTVDYSPGAIAKGSNGNLYVALQASGPSSTAVNPVGDASGKWGRVANQSDLDSISATATSAQQTAESAQSAVTTLDGNVVKLSGNQNIGGTKTFTSELIVYTASPNMTFKSSDLIQASNPSTNRYVYPIEFMDKNGDFLGYLEFLVGSGGNRRVGIATYKQDGTVTQLRLGFDTGGTPYITWDDKTIINGSDNQTIGGNKTFTGEIYIKRTIPMLILERIDTISSNYQDVRFKESDGTVGAVIRHIRGGDLNISAQYGTSGGWATGPYVTLKGGEGSFHIGAKQGGSTSTELIGNYNGNLTWRGNTIQTTSDERLKTAFSEFPDAVLDAWETISWEQFKYKSAVAEKGEENCRWHSGLVAQHVLRAFEDQGQDVLKYGILCYDEWVAEYADNDDGSKILTKEAGNQWTVRYEEALCMEAAYQRRRADRAEARIAALEQRLNEMEAVLASLIAPVGDETFAGSEEGNAE